MTTKVINICLSTIIMLPCHIKPNIGISHSMSLWHLKDEAWNLGRKLQNLDCHMYNRDIWNNLKEQESILIYH